jgi:hypothetical protein
VKPVVILDTNILCCLLQVPGKETAGSGEDRWDFPRADMHKQEYIDGGYDLFVPIVCLIEVATHIVNAHGNKHALITRFTTLLNDLADGTSPWAPVHTQADFWSAERLRAFAREWPQRAISGLSLADWSLAVLVEKQRALGGTVALWTADALLEAHAPAPIPEMAIPPRRHRR